MGCVTYKLKADADLRFTNIDHILSDKLMATLVASTSYKSETMETQLCVFERFFFRTSSSASLTVLFTKLNQELTADVIATGAGKGIYNFSWGTNTSFAMMAVEILESQGFRRLEE